MNRSKPYRPVHIPASAWLSLAGLVLFAFAVMFVMLKTPVGSTYCRSVHGEIGEESRLWVGGCQAKVNGKWVPYNRVRIIEDGREEVAP